MDYFIFKNISSSSFNNLHIASLPPITKPSIRTEEIKIDGKDGSIINNLGYSTYKKNITIVKLGNIDIESLKSWLDGEGQLILSNEPDKYYNAKVITDIDYSRFELYNKDKVEFLIQPYKYKVNEQPTTSDTSNFTVRNEGSCVSKPIITITGTGTITFSVNDSQIFTYTFPSDEGQVVIDSIEEEAYITNLSNLKNRNMSGDFPLLQPGNNTIEFTGNVTEVSILPMSRWL